MAESQWHMVLSLLAVFLTGVVLIIAAIVFTVDLANNTNVSSIFSPGYLQNVNMTLIIGGLIVILVGLLESHSVMNKIHIAAPTASVATQMVNAAPAALAAAPVAAPAAGPVGGLKIIRAETAKVEIAPTVVGPAAPKVAPAAAPKAAAPSSPAPAAPAAAPAKAAAAPSNMTFDEAIQNIVDRYNAENVKKSFRGWVNNLMMTFPDLNKSVVFSINGDEGITMSESVDEGAAVQVKLPSDILIKMLCKQINPIKAYSSGNLEVKGAMPNMLKLRKLMF